MSYAMMLSYTEIDSSVVNESGLGSGWLVTLGLVVGVLLVVGALALGSWLQQRTEQRPERGQVTPAATPDRTLTLHELDLSDSSDFDGVGSPGAPKPVVVGSSEPGGLSNIARSA